MARGRMISRSISNSRKLFKVSTLAKLIYTWTIPHTDDYGRMEGDWVGMKSLVIPIVQATDREVEKALKELEAADLISRYEVGGQLYLEIIGFDEHQTLKNDRPKKAEYPAPNELGKSWNQKNPNGKLCPRKVKVKLSQDEVELNTLIDIKKNNTKNAKLSPFVNKGMQKLSDLLPNKLKK